MPKIAYIEKNFTKKTLLVINQAMEIIDDYAERGFSLTLRQLYYQFVSRDLIPNRQREYNRLGSIINDARLTGYIDWKSIEDRTRSLRGRNYYDDPQQFIKSSIYRYNIDRWIDQDVHIEVWIEKDALVGVIERVCGRWDVDYFSCRGYTSQSEMWKAARRLGSLHDDGKRIVVIHLGDHDPSGIDMTRDIERRLNEFAIEPHYREDPEAWVDPEQAQYCRDYLWPIKVNRIALNIDQVRELDLPPNPAKTTDSRSTGYIEKYGKSSWELDALEPEYIERIIQESIIQEYDEQRYIIQKKKETDQRQSLQDIADNYDDIISNLDE